MKVRVIGMQPLYSILFCNQELGKYYENIRVWLQEGIKVFWFGNKEEVQKLEAEFSPFVSALFLQCYQIDIPEKTIIVDGEQCEAMMSVLEVNRPDFNVAQYMVEHCRMDQHIIVEASAGTGKTTVMIDRILFLLHTVRGLKLSDIYMITFTNDATNQMSEKLQNMLLKKYRLTGNIRYLRWLEEQSQMNISTIHSFAYMLLKEYGIESGFSKRIQLKTLNHERKELIKDGLDSYTSELFSVRSQIGMSLYQGNSTLDKYWKRLAQLGFSKREIMNMRWGKGIDDGSDKFQKALLAVFHKLDDEYYKLKQKNNAVALNDILRDLGEVLTKADRSLSDLSIKYLFVDEFQDSDNSQIKVLCWLVKHLKIKLFVVGDIKQSIYRFRGANDTAFSTLEEGLTEIGVRNPVSFTLVNNYRTAANVLKVMDLYFTAWASKGILNYKKPVKAMNTAQGKTKMYASAGKYSIEEQFCNVAKKALRERDERLLRNENKPTERDRVVVLCRTNRQLNELSRICQKNHIPSIIKREGNFYISAAVRDFYAMISSFVFSGDPKHLFNYLISPYANIEESMSIRQLEGANGDRDMLRSLLNTSLNKTNWTQYHKEFRLRPVMAVIKKMIEKEPIIDNYIAKLKRQQDEMGWSEKLSVTNALVQARQYKANLDKLMEILQRNGEGEYLSLYDIYSFLKVSIETNREEQEAEVEDYGNINCLYCMTVHKSKGMEFDTVIIPFTDTPFFYNSSTEVLVSNDNNQIGWKYVDRNTGAILQNTNYKKLRVEEEMNATQEETRILYVAMTRAINSLICLVAPDRLDNSWAHLIREVGVSYEE